MLKFRPVLIAFVAMTLLTSTTHFAYAILVSLRSTRNVPFSTAYPEYARQQVKTALQSENCNFIDGFSINAFSHLYFEGNTASVNGMLQKLADCPAASVSVSFQQIDRKCDWQIIYDAHFMKDMSELKFVVIFNLKSEQINIEQLIIPPAKGPKLQR